MKEAFNELSHQSNADVDCHALYCCLPTKEKQRETCSSARWSLIKYVRTKQATRSASKITGHESETHNEMNSSTITQINQPNIQI